MEVVGLLSSPAAALFHLLLYVEERFTVSKETGIAHYYQIYNNINNIINNNNDNNNNNNNNNEIFI